MLHSVSRAESVLASEIVHSQEELQDVKVVLFCGGQGMRIRSSDTALPKPMMPIGSRPILWHLMKYYASFGHTDFILCLGYKADTIKDYFMNYREWTSNDFILSNGGRNIRLLNSDIDDWTITFADTGMHATIGERLAAVEPHLADEAMFLANYADGLSDMNLPDYIDEFRSKDVVASFMAIRSPQSFHVASVDNHGLCTAIKPLASADIWFNSGFFILRAEIFRYLRPGEEMVNEPFQRLIAERKLMAYRYDGFWQAMDTFKDHQALEQLNLAGDAPWKVWQRPSVPVRAHAVAG
jgi:glucose-1-phosphate cytidylyltransferase